MSDPAVIVADPGDEHDGRMVTGRFLIVTLATFAYFLGLGSLLPTLPRYVEDELGGNGLEIGLVIGIRRRQQQHTALGIELVHRQPHGGLGQLIEVRHGLDQAADALQKLPVAERLARPTAEPAL
ncbi:MAG: hypothetical protein ABL966_11415 [Acidimicrobiales bacterium]